MEKRKLQKTSLELIGAKKMMKLFLIFNVFFIVLNEKNNFKAQGQMHEKK